jgi:hypothetical protein
MLISSNNHKVQKAVQTEPMGGVRSISSMHARLKHFTLVTMDGQIDGRIDGRTNGRTDQQTDRPTLTGIELLLYL